MGVPLTRFSMLSRIMHRGKPRDFEDKLEKDVAYHFFRQFNLYAIVLCKHDNHDFINYMSENFERLDRRTGKNLLFFSLAEPGITTEIQGMSWEPNAAMMDAEKYPIDEDIYLYVLTQALKISRNDFPSILITNSLESCNWYVINTSVGQVQGDLMILTGLANDPDFRFESMIEDELNGMIRDAGRYWYSVEGKIPLCELLASVEAAAATHSSDREKSLKAVKIQREVERRLIEYGDEEYDDLVNLFQCLKKPKVDNYDYNILESLWQDTNNLEPDTISYDYNILKSLCQDTENLEPDTMSFLEVYDKLLTMYSENLLNDHSVLCSLTHKIFESELNASVLQLMRAFIHIPMPEYYNKWYDGAENKDAYNVTTANGSAVSLNAYIKGNPRKYRSPGLGNTYYAFQALCACREWNELCAQFGFEENQIRLFSHLWENIFRDRNFESHCTSMNRIDYQRLTYNVNQVLERFLSNMIKIKKSLHQ